MADNRDRRNDRNREENDGLTKKLIAVNRVTKTVKGGRNMRFSALVVVGDGMGKVGLGMGKAAEVPEAIEKATQQAKHNVEQMSLKGNTIPHATTGKFGRGQVLLLPAEEGSGVIAGGAVRMVLEVAGVKDIRTKSLGSNNPINSAKATIEGLRSLRNADEIAKLRGVEIAVD
ncbi:MAG: 30S ribosomal protein S5 [Bacteroides sp.]|nr:30S ribosomal protein S5 [Bacillota bacterium]MCM1393979.1 30S ribosomal protein S5 [[Eubacterium] siraeum]MCM1455693.1 30S ribosomal protein S5 [Bacteroides sp.]